MNDVLEPLTKFMHIMGYDTGEFINIYKQIIFTTILCGVLIISLFFILGAIGLSKIMKKASRNNSYQAYIPFFNKYVIGEISLNKQVGYLLFFLFLSIPLLFIMEYIISIIINIESYKLFINIFINIIYLVYLIIYTVCIYKICKKFKNGHPVSFAIKTFISGGLFGSLYLFNIRNKELISPFESKNIQLSIDL